MRYQSALVLSTLAVGQAAAGNLRHASFHARRSANIAPGPEGVAWNNVVRDAVDYKAITDKFTAEQWKEIFASQEAAAAQATTAAPVAAAEATSYAAPAEPTSKKEEPAKEEPSKTSEAAPAKTSEASSGGKGSILSALGCSEGKNADAPNGQIWKGDSGSKTQVTFTNDADEDSAVFCWDKDSMFHTKSSAIIAMDVPGGSSLTLSIAPGFSGGCGAAYSDSSFHFSGILDESILEFTTAPENPGMYDFGAYDISREVNMNGIVMSATGNRQCTSGIKNGEVSCAFGCVGGAKSCEATGTYNIIAGSEDSQYCMANGKDPWTGGASGGCQLNPDGDHMKVTYSKNRSWPAATF